MRKAFANLNDREAWSAYSDNNVVQGNFIGTDATGTNDLGNSQSGILIDGTLLEASSNLIGGESPVSPTSSPSMAATA